MTDPKGTTSADNNTPINDEVAAELATKDTADLSEAEAARLAYARSEVSLADYNPHELGPEEKVVEWDGASYENSAALAEAQPQATVATPSFAEADPNEPTPASRKGDKDAPAAASAPAVAPKAADTPAESTSTTSTTTK